MPSNLDVWEVREEITGVLKEILVSTLTTKNTLIDWMIANVVYLFRKGNMDKPGHHHHLWQSLEVEYDDPPELSLVYCLVSRGTVKNFC